MELQEYLNYRSFLLDESKDEEGFISESSFINVCLPGLNDARLIETDECNECLCVIDNEQLKINAYVLNESGERLQVFILNEDSIDLEKPENELAVSQKAYYEKQFNRCISFIRKASKRHLENFLQDNNPVNALVNFLSSSEGIGQVDVVEVFLISATATIETRGEVPQPKRIDFEDDSFKISFTRDKQKIEKEIIIIRRLIDLNFLYNVSVSQGNREALKIDFTSQPFNHRISFIQAASEEYFDSYLCVLPANLLAELYKRYSSRMLEKNVRSFLQLKGVNKGMQDTIKGTPEKFIAFNNGLTITATGRELDEVDGHTYIKSLTDFQIVNGGQTTATIYFSKKAGLDVSKVKVMAKINVAKDASEEELDDLISNISTYSNAQSKVSKVDLRSRSAELIKLKSLSESIVTPSGKKWFFERAKGEFNTLIRKSPHQKNRIEKEYPKERRFTKEELAKYYSAWDDKPYMVKKGGEKVFRYFIEIITGAEKKGKGIAIDRAFFEDTVARIILFRTLEKIYGQGFGSIGQIRSAVVPYSISVVYSWTTGYKEADPFDLSRIWKTEGLEEDLQLFFKELMLLMNDLIKKYADSDDYGEYSKKPELWEVISECEEIYDFMQSTSAKKILKRYSVSREELKKRTKKYNSAMQVNFESLLKSAAVYSNTEKVYRKSLNRHSSNLKQSEVFKLEQMIAAIKNHDDIKDSHLVFEARLMQWIRVNDPGFFDTTSLSEDQSWKKTADFIVKIYNKTVESGNNIRSDFKFISEKARQKGAKYASVYDEIGRQLETGILPSMKQVKMAWEYVSLLNGENK